MVSKGLSDFVKVERNINMDGVEGVYMALKDYKPEMKHKCIIVPRTMGFNELCRFFFDKGIEDFKAYNKQSNWVIEFGRE